VSILFAANALWWGYRMGATLARAYLGFRAQEAGTTLPEAFKDAERRQARGEFDAQSRALFAFVKFNDQWAWEDFRSFSIDTAAVATAGLGLAAKIGLGKRIAAVFGVKQVDLGGAVIDSMIDFAGALFSGKVQNPVNLIGEVFSFIAKSREDLAPIFNAGNRVVDASVAVGAAIGGILDPKLLTPIALGKAIPAVIDLFGAILGLWGVIEPALPKPGTTLPGAVSTPLPLDPAFRNALRDVGKKAGKPDFRSSITPRPRARPRFDPQTRMELPPEDPAPISEELLEKLFKAQEEGKRLPDGITITKIAGSPATVQRQFFTRRFSRMGQPDLRRIIDELKKG